MAVVFQQCIKPHGMGFTDKSTSVRQGPTHGNATNLSLVRYSRPKFRPPKATRRSSEYRLNRETQQFGGFANNLKHVQGG